jgi:transcriptional regulator with GAF, ATPase, and Fis domain
MRSFARGGGSGAGANGDGRARSGRSRDGVEGRYYASRLRGLHRKVALLKDLAIELLSEIESLEARAARDDCGHLRDEMKRLEVELITCALKEAGWNQAAAARRLGLRPTTLFCKIKSHGIDVMKPREP